MAEVTNEDYKVVEKKEHQIIHGNVVILGNLTYSGGGGSHNFSATVDPTVNDDVTLGYGPGSIWINETTEESWKCITSTIGAAVWVQTSIDADDLGDLAFYDSTAIPVNLYITNAVTPSILLTDTTNGATARIGANDGTAFTGSFSAHPFDIYTDSVKAASFASLGNGLTLGKAGSSFAIQQSNTNSALYLSGGTSNILGGNIILWGQASAQGDSIWFRDGSGTVGKYDASALSWVFSPSGNASGATAWSSYDDVIIDSGSDTGIGLLSPDANYSGVSFNSTTKSLGAYLAWSHDDNNLLLATNAVGHEVKILGANNVLGVTVGGASGAELTTFVRDVVVGRSVLTTAGGYAAVTTGQGRHYSDATNGFVLQGFGSAYDWRLLNQAGSPSLSGVANTQNTVAFGNFTIPATSNLYLDGGGDTYIDEYAANSVRIVTGGKAAFKLNDAPADTLVIASDGTTTLDGAFIITRANNNKQLNLIRTGSSTANGWIHVDTDTMKISSDVAGAPSGTKLSIDLISGDLGVTGDVSAVGGTFTDSIGIGSAPTFGTGSGLDINRAGAATIRLENTVSVGAFEMYVGTDNDVHFDVLNGGMEYSFDANASFANNLTLSEGKLEITDTANEVSLAIVASASTVAAVTLAAGTTSSRGLDIFADTLTSGSAIRIYSNAPSSATRNEAHIWNNNGTATGTTVMYLQNDSTGLALKTKGAIETDTGIYLGGTAAANLLDDYEEGTFTPNLNDLSNSATLSTAIGNYTKIGNTVFYNMYIALSSLGSVSGACYLGGLPFTSENIANNNVAATVDVGAGLAVTAGHNIGAYVVPNSTAMALMLWDATTGTSPLQATEISADGSFGISGHYQTAS